MRTYDVFRVDAFTDRALAGNPCAVVLGADDLRDDELRKIAKEFNLPETAFVLRSEQADIRARYFTPAEEIPLAGHPTIATTIALLEAGIFQMKGHPLRFRLELKAGIIPIDVARDEAGNAFVTMTQLRPEFLQTYPAADVAPLFGLTEEDLLPDVPVQTVSTGTPMLMVPLRSFDALRRASLNVRRYVQARTSGDFFGPHLFCMKGATPEGQTFARNFSLPPDNPEDPFTGSATGCMAAYVWHYGLIKEPRFTAEQGHWMGRPGMAQVEIVGPADDIESVRVSGTGVVVMKGSVYV